MRALVRVDDLARDLTSQVLHVLDVQYALMGPPSEDLYAAEHLPGAQHLPMEGALAGPAGAGGRHPLPDPNELQEALRQLGVDDESRIVVYDQQTSLAAARAWWVLRWAGLTDVHLAWREFGHPTTADVPTPRRGTVTLHPGATAFLDDVAAGHWAGSGRLLDVRTPERYRGEVEPIDPIAGRIPGAINLPMGLMMQADGTFRTPEEIRNAAAGAGIDLTSPVGTSCGSGITAAWITDPDRPIARG